MTSEQDLGRVSSREDPDSFFTEVPTPRATRPRATLPPRLRSVLESPTAMGKVLVLASAAFVAIVLTVSLLTGAPAEQNKSSAQPAWFGTRLVDVPVDGCIAGYPASTGERAATSPDCAGVPGPRLRVLGAVILSGDTFPGVPAMVARTEQECRARFPTLGTGEGVGSFLPLLPTEQQWDDEGARLALCTVVEA